MTQVVYQFAEKYKGAKFVAKDTAAQVHTMPGLGYGSVYNCEPGYWFVATGNYAYYEGDGNAIYIQTTKGWWIYVDSTSDYDNWTVYANAVQLPSYSRDDVQRFVNAIIANNQHITENNLLCARYAHYFTKEQQQQIVKLQKRVQERYDAIAETGFCEDIQKGEIAGGYAEFEPYLAKLMQDGSVGLVWWAWCIIAAVAVGALVGVSYFVYQDFFAESKDDVKFSDDLTKTLKDKLTEEEYAQLEKETAGLITKATIREKFGNIWGIVKYAAVAVGALFAFKFLNSALDNIGKKK